MSRELMRDFIERGGGSSKQWDKTPNLQAGSKRKSCQLTGNNQVIKKNKKETLESDSTNNLMDSNDLLVKIGLMLDSKFSSFKGDVISAIDGVNEKVTAINDRVEAHDNVLYKFNNRINAIEQARLNQQLEVTGLNMPAFVDVEEIKTIFIQYCDSINIHIPSEYIIDAYVKTKTNEKGTKKSVIIIFIQESITSRVIREKISHDKNNQMQASIFFGPVLTHSNYKLLMTAKNFKKQKKLASAWTMGGKIYIKLDMRERGIVVESEEHLNWLVNDKTRSGVDDRDDGMFEESIETNGNSTVINNNVTQQSTSTPANSATNTQETKFYTPMLKSPVLNAVGGTND